jgi:hypothetical protein
MTRPRAPRPGNKACWWIAIAICVGTYGLIFLAILAAIGGTT